MGHKGYRNPGLLVSSSELSERLGREDVLLIDVRPWKAYEKSHIPGASNLDLFSYHWMDTSPKGLEAFTRHMCRVLSPTGASPEKFVVFYDDISGMSAARGIWLMEYLGHKKASVLDGGLKAWVKNGLPVDSLTVEMSLTNFKISPRKELIASKDYVLKNLKNPSIQLLDARSPEEYTGIKVRGVKRGHIPGAVNVEWRRNLNRDGTFKDFDRLQELYRQAGILEDKEVVVYCQGGYRAAHAYLALRLLGYPKVRNYIGSWAEWGSDPELPAELSLL